jgi:hypothetical protein
VTLTLSTPFDMTGFKSGSAIDMQTAQTAITIVGNGAVFDAGGKDNFFYVRNAVALVMSNVTLQNGVRGYNPLLSCYTKSVCVIMEAYIGGTLHTTHYAV